MRFNFACALLGALVSAGDIPDYGNLTQQIVLKNVKAWTGGPEINTTIDPNTDEVVNKLQAGGSTAWSMEGDGDKASLVQFITQSVVNKDGKLSLPDDTIVRVALCTATPDPETTIWCSLNIFEKSKITWQAWQNDKSNAYPTRPEASAGTGNTLQDWLVTGYFAQNTANAKMLNDETMALPAKTVTKASGASNSYTWLAVNQNAEWNKEMQMTFVDIMPVSDNGDYIKAVKAGTQKFTGTQYLEVTHVDGQVFTHQYEEADISYSMAAEPSEPSNDDSKKDGEGDAAMLSFATAGLGTLATAIAVLNF